MSYLIGVRDTWKSVGTLDDVPIILPLKGQNIPFIGFLIEKFACNKIDVQAQSIAKSVGVSTEGSKASARREVISKLNVKNEIYKEGNTRSYLTIALCVGCYFLGIFPTIALVVAVCSALMTFSVRNGDTITMIHIQAIEHPNEANQQLLRGAHLGGLI